MCDKPNENIRNAFVLQKLRKVGRSEVEKRGVVRAYKVLQNV